MAIADITETVKRALVPVTEAATYLSVSRSTVYNLMDSGQLRWVKIGKSRRVRWEDVEKLIADNTFGG